MQVGALVDGRYRLVEEAGRGGMGTVFRAVDERADEPVAVKVLRHAMPPQAQAESAARFAREAKTLASLDHPAVVRYRAHGSTEGVDWLVTEWLEGRDLHARLRDAPLTVAETLEVGRRVAAVLSSAHARGVVHRDIKPGNLFLVDDDVTKVRVLDFGVAFNREMASVTTAGSTVGTPAYMAPEQARSEGAIEGAADLFSLGCVLWECLAGRRAFEGQNAIGVLAKVLLEEVPDIATIVDGVPDAVAQSLASALDKDPRRRPSPSLLAELFADVLATIPEGQARRPAPIRASSPTGLTDREQRVVTVVLARASTGAAAETMTTHEHATRVARLAMMAERYGARVEELANGTVAAVLMEGAATDLARRAARIAQALRALFEGAPVGLATGRAVLADRLPVGDAIDAAAEQLQCARERGARERGARGAIALDETTAGLLGRRFEIGGDAGGLLLLAEHERDAPRHLLGRPTRFVGRKRELALLEAAVAEASEEHVSRAALVSAESGVGKTRLLRELLKRLEASEDPVEVWLTQGELETAGSPHALAAALIRDAAAISGGDAPDVARTKLLSHVSQRMGPSEAERVTTFLAELVGARSDASPSPQLAAARLDPRLMGDQIRRAFEDFVDAACADGALVIAVDDLHWGDKPSVDLLDRLLRNLAERPLVVLGLARPELSERLGEPWQERGLTRVHLTGLPPRAARRFVVDMLESVDAAQVDAMVERADGHAFTLEELVRAEAEGRGGELPQTVLAIAQARLGGIPSAERRLLRAASVFGKTFWRGGVEQLLGRLGTGPATIDHLASLERRELIEARRPSRFADDEEWVFRHATVRDAAYGMLTPEDRELGHRLAGEWLERAGENDPFRLADHAERGRVAEAAVRHNLRAAEQALQGDDLEIAERSAERGIAAGAEGEALGRLRLVLATAAGWRGRTGDARRLALAAREALTAGSDAWARAVERETSAALTLGLLDVIGEAETLLSRCAPSHMTTRVLARLAVVAFQAGQAERARGLLTRVEAIPEALRAPPDVAAALHRARASSATRRGDDAECLVHLRLAAGLQEEAGARRDACIERTNAAVLEAQLGLYDDAEAHLRAALAEARRMGLAIVVDAARTNLGDVLTHLGRDHEARSELGAAFVSLHGRGDRRFLGAVHAYLARALVAGGQLGEAERHARLAVEHLRDFAPVHPFSLAVLAEVLLASDRPADALDAADRAMDAVRAGALLEQGASLVRWTHIASLDAVGDPAADAAAIEAAALIRERASRIQNAAWRESFLERVPEHGATLRRAALATRADDPG